MMTLGYYELRWCSKCHGTSGGDWSQCGGSCPMEMSPYYTPPQQPPYRGRPTARSLINELRTWCRDPAARDALIWLLERAEQEDGTHND